MESIFDKELSELIVTRISMLNSNIQPEWGSMNVAEMLAHCNLTYDLVYSDHYVKAEAFNRLIYSTMMVNIMTNDDPYPKNMETAPAFMTEGEYSFDEEKEKLIANIRKVLDLGPGYFEEQDNMAFGKLNAYQWHNLFYKHLDHHLRQFGV